MPNPSRGADLFYRGLYAGISEAAAIMGFSRQYVSYNYSVLPWLRAPLGYLSPDGEHWPYWFRRDVVADARSRGMIVNELSTADDVQLWEYNYTGRVITANGFARLCGVGGNNVHLTARERLQAAPADTLKMGAVWREDDVLAALKTAQESV